MIRTASKIRACFAAFVVFTSAWWFAACRRSPQIGDHILVDWRGDEHPAVIVGVEGPSKFHVHYDGYSDDWNETIPATRVRGRLSTNPSPPQAGPPLTKSKASASGSATPPPPGVYRTGDRVRVEWHGSVYPATILNVLGDDRYRVHYEGYGNEWDEDITMSRIQRKGN
ncbi:MAG TPA: hypothetical protein VJT73_18395 [Polyangiaceae bacterium]|nr:hypothetical protein [Polyangiaceae bacterium]